MDSNDIPMVPTQDGEGMASASSKGSVAIPVAFTVRSRPDSIYFPGGRVLTTQDLVNNVGNMAQEHKTSFVQDGQSYDIHAVMQWHIPKPKDNMLSENLQKYLDENDLPSSDSSGNRGTVSHERKKFLRREKFEQALISKWGAIIQHEVMQDYLTVSVKISFPFESLCQAAEAADLEKACIPVMKAVTGESTASKKKRIPLTTRLQKWVRNWRFLKTDDLPESANHAHLDPMCEFEAVWTCFRVSQKEKFQHYSNPKGFFTPSEKLVCVKFILDSVDNGVVNGQTLDRLEHDLVFSAVFPIHSLPDATESAAVKNPRLSMATWDLAVAKGEVIIVDEDHRDILHKTWASWSSFLRWQPLNRIRFYFGEQTAYYFQWLDFYVMMLLPVAFIGLAVFLYGLFFFNVSSPTRDISEFCSSEIVMCPICQFCDPWILKNSCEAHKAGYIFDNGATLLFAAVMSIWATCYLEIWKRQITVVNSSCADAFQETAEPNRPAFIGPELTADADFEVLQLTSTSLLMAIKSFPTHF